MKTRFGKRWAIIGIVGLLLVVSGLLMASTASVASPPSQSEPSTPLNYFTGYVRRCPSTTTGIAGVTVRLQRYDYYNWVQVASTTTDANGHFSLTHSPVQTFEDYRIVETDPAGYTSCNAVAGALGAKVNNNTIEYDDIGIIGTYDGNIFYDAPPNNPPQPISVTPHDGSSAAWVVQVFTIVASDADGASDIMSLYFQVDDHCGWPVDHNVYVRLDPASNRVYLEKDDASGMLEGILPGPGLYGTGTLENGQVIVRLDKTRFSRSGNQLTFEVGLRFKNYLGTWKLCAEARDAVTARSAEFGTWRVTQAVTVTPTRTRTRTGTPTKQVTATATKTPVATQGQIVAVVYHDLNTNGTKDAGEPPLSGVRVRLFQGDTRVRVCDTDANGRCTFANLAPGVYRVSEIDPTGFGSTTANDVNVDISTVPVGNAFFGDRILPQVTVQLKGEQIPAGMPSVELSAGVNIGDQVRFTITVRNTGVVNVNPIQLSLTYNTTCWDYVSASDPPLDSADDGVLNWTIYLFGNPLHPGDEFSIDVTLRAVGTCSNSQVCAKAAGLDSTFDALQSPMAQACQSWNLAKASLEVSLNYVGVFQGGIIIEPGPLPVTGSAEGPHAAESPHLAAESPHPAAWNADALSQGVGRGSEGEWIVSPLAQSAGTQSPHPAAESPHPAAWNADALSQGIGRGLGEEGSVAPLAPSAGRGVASPLARGEGVAGGGVSLLADVTAGISDTLVFDLVIHNTGTTTATQVRAWFQYNEGWFTEGFTDPHRDTSVAVSLPPPSDIRLGWDDVTTTLGDLPPDASITVRINVHAAVLGQGLFLCGGADGWDIEQRYMPEVVSCKTVDITGRVWANVWHDMTPPFGIPPQAWEPPLAGATLELRGPGDVLVDACLTDGFGTCGLLGVAPNVQYIIREINPPGYDIDTTPNEYPYSVSPNDPVAQLIMFGDRRSPRIELGVMPVPEACISDTMTVAVVVTNAGDLPLETTALSLSYDTHYLRYLGLSSLPTVDNHNDGQINWADLFPGLGGLAPQATYVVTAAFHAEAATNVPTMVHTEASGTDMGGNPVPLVTSDTPVSIHPYDPGPCVNILLDGDFESGLAAWNLGTNTGPGCGAVPNGLSPLNPHGGAQSLRLGGLAGCWSMADATRTFFLPSTVKSATLSYWFRINDPVYEPGGAGGPPDALEVYVASGVSFIGTPLEYGTSGWTHRTIDITSFAGQMASVTFVFGQDGQVDQPAPAAFIDDVTVCINECGAPHDDSNPTDPPVCWKAGGYVDYAPSGMPDFDQKQSDWQNTQGQWTYDGPAALGNSLWWFDSKFEPGTTPPPAISNGYPLIPAGAKDDHAAANVVPFINILAVAADTDGQDTLEAHGGTRPGDLRDGVESYLTSRGLLNDYTVLLEPAPQWDWVRSEISRSEDIVMLVGFWEYQANGWRRLGGHYVTGAGVGCTDDRIAISDPYFDRAEEGWPGRVLPAGVHDHPAVPPDTTHNDARKVSHDIYAVMPVNVPGAAFALAGYAPTYDDIANFAGLNGTPGQPTGTYEGGAVVAAVEYALAVSPREPGAELWIEPALSSVAMGDVFSVTLMVDAAGGGVDKASVALGFDPNVLEVVNAAGAPVGFITPGAAFSAYLLNVANNTTGYIDLVTARESSPIEGRFVLATIYLHAKASTDGSETPLNLVSQGDHVTNLWLGSASMLSSHHNGAVIVAGAAARLVGKVTLEGRPEAPDPAWQGPVDVMVFEAGEDVAARVVGLYTDQQGRFIVEDLASGAYDVRVKGTHTLAIREAGVSLHEGSNSIALGTLPEGDANNDNRVDPEDAAILAASMGLSEGDAGYDAAADFNNDHTVDGDDQALLAANYGLVGDEMPSPLPLSFGMECRGIDRGEESPHPALSQGVGRGEESPHPAAWNADALSQGIGRGWEGEGTGAPLAPSAGRGAASPLARGEGVASEANLAATRAKLRLLPAEITGTAFGVDVKLEAGAGQADTVAVHVDFDPALLAVVDQSGNAVRWIQNRSGMAVLVNKVDNAAGTIDFVVIKGASGPVSGDKVLATARFKVKMGIGATWLRFSTVAPRQTGAFYQAQPTLAGLYAAQVHLAEAETAVYMPLLLKR